MNTAENLIVFLEDCVKALKAADKLGINISEDISKIISKKFPSPIEYMKIQRISGETTVVQKPTPHEIALSKVNKLEAVKAYKDRTGESLMNAKYAIEQV